MRLLLPVLLATLSFAQEDPRTLSTGRPLPGEGYSDQPLVVTLPDGRWLAVLTTGAGAEGGRGQHVVATTSANRGNSWSKPVDIEPEDGPEASWAVPLLAPNGRVFVFYTYNLDDLRDRRADMLGAYMMRWSDDGGATWSPRVRLPVRTTAIDRGNDFGGDMQMLWGVSHPVVTDGQVLLPFTKIGEYLVKQTEAWFLHSPDLLTVTDPSQATWDLWPEGDHGLGATGRIASEPCLALLPDGRLACVLRTVDGHPLLATSADGGRSWSEPAPIRDDSGQVIKHPRANVRLWAVQPGRYLLWTHENDTPTWAPGTRNPAWVRAGTFESGALHFGPPEILLYDPDPRVRISYPDLVLEQDGLYLLETQKTRARTHRFEWDFVEALFERAPRTREQTPDLVGPFHSERSPVTGWTFEAWIQLEEDGARPLRLWHGEEEDRAITLSVEEDGALALELRDGERTTRHGTESGIIRAGAVQHIAVVFDLQANILRWIVDGRVLDGGTERNRGWAWLADPPAPNPDEKFLVREDGGLEVQLEDSGLFRLGDPDKNNALIIPVGGRVTLRTSFGKLAQFGILTTGVGFKPTEDLAFPADGTVHLLYGDELRGRYSWNLSNSDGAGRGEWAQAAPGTWTLVRSADGERWDDRRFYWQTFETDPLLDLVELEFDLSLTVSASEGEAEIALLAFSVIPAGAPTGATLSPFPLDPALLNGDVFARDAHDSAGRGFHDPPPPPSLAARALGILPRAQLEVGPAVLAHGLFDRALLATEVRAIFDAGR
jgi:BNR repeat-like domain/Concanavalin A-like lectin/glucanases superfamily